MQFNEIKDRVRGLTREAPNRASGGLVFRVLVVTPVNVFSTYRMLPGGAWGHERVGRAIGLAIKETDETP